MIKRRVAYGVVAVVLFLALVRGCVVDVKSHEDLPRGCHFDFYLWVIPVGHVCLD